MPIEHEAWKDTGEPTSDSANLSTHILVTVIKEREQATMRDTTPGKNDSTPTTKESASVSPQNLTSEGDQEETLGARQDSKEKMGASRYVASRSGVGELSPIEQDKLLNKGYSVLKQIGEGVFAKVYLSKYMNAETREDKYLACKIIDCNTCPTEFVNKFLPRELEIIAKLHHPHIVHVYSIYKLEDKYFIFMRVAERGDLLDYLREYGAVNEGTARHWFSQVAQAVRYLHTLSIAHRDIKLENILLTSNFNVKLTDFGFSRFVIDASSRSVKSNTFCGSLSYASPEILKGKPYHPKTSDIWAMGVVLFAILNKAMPFNDANPHYLYNQQIRRQWKMKQDVAKSLSHDCLLLLHDLLEPQANARVTVKQIFEYKWFGKRDSKQIEREVEALKKAQRAAEASKPRGTILTRRRDSKAGQSAVKTEQFAVFENIQLEIPSIMEIELQVREEPSSKDKEGVSCTAPSTCKMPASEENFIRHENKFIEIPNVVSRSTNPNESSSTVSEANRRPME